MGRTASKFKAFIPKPKILRFYFWQRLLIFLKITIIAGLLVVSTDFQSFAIFKSTYNSSAIEKIHPLPQTLVKWQDQNNSGDYFDQIQSTQVGYLVWSQFPVRVYIASPNNTNNNQAQAWVKAVSQTVAEWNAYLPLQLVEQPEAADIQIIRKAPPLQGNPPRARSAQTSYQLYTKSNSLYHRFTILLSPSQTGEYLIAAARHELGHALGIWGHSQLQSDALYFSQVRNPPPISPRDVNTLKKIYQQATRLGWKVD